MDILENGKINITSIDDISILPKVLFKNPKSQDIFWDDEYISKQMLDAHLNPDCNAASRKIVHNKRLADIDSFMSRYSSGVKRL